MDKDILGCKWSRVEPSIGEEMIPQAHCQHPESIKEMKEGGFVGVLCLGPELRALLGTDITIGQFCTVRYVCPLFEEFKDL